MSDEPKKLAKIHAVEIQRLSFYKTPENEFLCSAEIEILLPSLADPDKAGPELTIKLAVEADPGMQLQAVERALLTRAAEILRDLAQTTGEELLDLHQMTQAERSQYRG